MSSWSELLAARHRGGHDLILGAIADLADEELRRRPGAGPQSIGWQVWHVARWQDRFASILASRSPALAGAVPVEEVWSRQAVAVRWGWTRSLALGDGDAGTGLDDDAAAGLPLPGREELIEYAANVFAYAEEAVARLDEATLLEPLPQAEGQTYADLVLGFAEHTYEHVGTIYAVRGALGLRGAPD